MFGSSSSFRSLSAPHSKVHESMQRMVKQLDRGWERNPAIQDSICEALDCAEKASLEVMHMMDQIVADKHPGMAKTS